MKVVRRGALALLMLVASWHPDARAQQKVRMNPLIEALAKGGIAEDRAVTDPNTGDKVWTFIDMEHAAFPTWTEVQPAILKTLKERKPNGQLLSVPSVRLPMYGFEDPSYMVKQGLDSGALSLSFPHIETREQALRAVRAMRFPPQRGTRYPEPPGVRGSGGVPRSWTAAGIKMPIEEYRRIADLWPLNPEGELFAIMWIESPKGVANIQEIASVPGVGAVIIGPTDLGSWLGVGVPKNREPIHPDEEAEIQKVLKGCKAVKTICGIAATWTTKEGYQSYIKQGFQLFQDPQF